MAGEVSREDFGMTDKGNVFVLKLMHYSDDGNKELFTYQVRHGAHTVSEFASKAKADALAKALVA